MSTGTAPTTVHTFCRYCLASCGIEVIDPLSQTSTLSSSYVGVEPVT